MKPKFVLLSLLLLVARGCDFYSTSLWFFQPHGKRYETNPLTQYLDIGWNGLVIANAVLVLLTIAMFYHYCFIYRPAKTVDSEPKNFLEYASCQYFRQPDKFYQILYKMPQNKSVMFAHTGYVLIRVLIIASFLATIHNLSQYYQLGYYDTLRDLIGRPLLVLYGLIIFSAAWIFRKLLRAEFAAYQSQEGH